MNVRTIAEAVKEFQRAQGTLAAVLSMAAAEVGAMGQGVIGSRPTVKRAMKARGIWTSDGRPGRPHMQIGQYVSNEVRQDRKVCTKCRTVKFTDAFGPSSQARSGLQSWCNKCVAKQAHERMQG